MFAKIMKMKNRKTKGFTLVELIVVLIILGILAALLLPTLTGYIDKAHQESAVAQCRMGVMAAKTVGAEAYEEHFAAGGITAEGDVDKNEIATLAEFVKTPEGADDMKVTFEVVFAKDGTVVAAAYKDSTSSAAYTSTGFTSGKAAEYVSPSADDKQVKVTVKKVTVKSVA